MPSSPACLLQSRWFYTVATTILTAAFWWSGFDKLLHFADAQAEMEHFGLHPATWFAALTIAVQLISSALIIAASRWAHWGAGALILFTLATIPLAHRFWEMDGLLAILEHALVMDHISVIGGLLVAMALAQRQRARPKDGEAAHPALQACWQDQPEAPRSTSDAPYGPNTTLRTAHYAFSPTVAHSQFLRSPSASVAALRRHMHGNRSPFHGLRR